MALAVVERHLHVDDGIAREHAFLQGALHALVNGRYVVLWDRTAGDLVDELVALALGCRLDADVGDRVLPPAPGLLDVTRLVLRASANRFAVREPKRDLIDFDAELPL